MESNKSCNLLNADKNKYMGCMSSFIAKMGAEYMKFYAHTKGNDKKDWQKLKDHLTAVADMSRVFAERFGAGELGYMAGTLQNLRMLHK